MARLTNTNATSLVMAGRRLGALRELMRLEMPDTYADVQLSGSQSLSYLLFPSTGGGQGKPYIPRTSQIYQNYIASSPTRLTPPQNSSGSWTTLINSALQNNSAGECLYMVITLASEDRDATSAAIAVPDTSDTDMDGMKEIADGWGNPILWCRWPSGMGAPNGTISGLLSDLQPMYSVPRSASPPDPRVRLSGTGQMADPNNTNNILTRDPPNNHDSFDPLQIDRWEPNSQGPWSALAECGYTLFPLIMSGGPDFDPTQSNNPSADDGFGVRLAPANVSGSSQPFSLQNAGCPYYNAGTSSQSGMIKSPSAYNNVHNHTLGTLR
jgi:hypothetical protein